MLNKIFFLTVAVSLSLYSCDTTEETSSTAKKSTWSPKMDEPSELAQIMRDLHEEGLQRKASLEKGELFSGSVDNLLLLLLLLVLVLSGVPHVYLLLPCMIDVPLVWCMSPSAACTIYYYYYYDDDNYDNYDNYNYYYYYYYYYYY